MDFDEDFMRSRRGYGCRAFGDGVEAATRMGKDESSVRWRDLGGHDSTFVTNVIFDEWWVDNETFLAKMI